MKHEVKYEMKHGDLCPYCEQELFVEDGVFQCGGDGEGICSIWSAINDFGKAVQRLPKYATINVELWIDTWLADFIGQSWTEVGWNRALHLRGVRETWNLTADTEVSSLTAHKLDKERHLDMPAGLDDAGQRAYTIITEYLKQHELTHTGGCKAFYSPAEWKSREEAYGTESRLVVVYNGGDLCPVFSMDAAYDLDCAIYQETGKSRTPYSLYEGMQEKLREAGLYFEECTRWYSAVYSIHQGKVV